jgi:hypothetical protein
VQNALGGQIPQSQPTDNATMHRVTRSHQGFQAIWHYKGQTTRIENEGLLEISNRITYQNLELDANF